MDYLDARASTFQSPHEQQPTKREMNSMFVYRFNYLNVGNVYTGTVVH